MMRKGLGRISIVACLPLFFTGTAFALFDLTPDITTIPFGNTKPGDETPAQIVHCDIQSDDSSGWSVQLSAAPLLNADGKTPYPASMFRYWLNSNGPGQEIPPFNSDAAVPQLTTNVYVADPSEYVSHTAVDIGFKVIAPLSPPPMAGNYTSQISILLVSNF